MKSKLLCILHRSPPTHGAAKVGDLIASSTLLKKEHETYFITIKSSDTIGDIGKINLKKFYFVAELFVKIAWALIVFRPDKIYFTASIRSVAFYRDLLLSTLWKLYSSLTNTDIYYHYHTKGVNNFVSASPRNLALTRWFVGDVNLILLSPMLEHDFAQVQTYKKVLFLPNGVEDPLQDSELEMIIDQKYKTDTPIHILYLAHMMKDKGYIEALSLAEYTKNRSIIYHFAGSWQSESDKEYFETFVQNHALEKSVFHHGFVSGLEKKSLLQQAHIFLYPSKNEAFGLALIEAFSYGIPSIATDEGSFPFIIDEKSGIIIQDLATLPAALEQALQTLINPETAIYCRKRYEENFTLERFEGKFMRIIHD